MKVYLSYFIIILTSLTSLNTIGFVKTNSNDEVIIQLERDKLLLNFKSIEIDSEIQSYEEILGKPTREQRSSEKEIKNTVNKMGSLPNNIYTYDSKGILLYQKVNTTIVNSITIELKKLDYKFSSSKPFSGILMIDGKQITKETSLDELNQLNNLNLSESIFFVKRGRIGQYSLTFVFDENIQELESISISKSNNEIQNGWTKNSFDMIKAGVKSRDEFKELAKEYNFSLDEFSDCYANKIIREIPLEELEKLNSVTQNKIVEIVESCILEAQN